MESNNQHQVNNQQVNNQAEHQSNNKINQVNKPERFAQAHSGLNNQVIQIIQRVEQYLMELNKMTTNLYLSLSILEKLEISKTYKKEIVEAIAPMASRVATRVKIEKKF